MQIFLAGFIVLLLLLTSQRNICIH